MPPKINLLPDVLINKIAAGEVIERPASVVKELVENALDAQAASVFISVTEGGLSRIEVNDNGYGMTPDDLRVAVQRHATSKLEKPEDLFNIHSFGFRGEALPSITSVSQFTIKSRPHDADHGYQLDIDGGTVTNESEVGCDYGTFITVRNLFFNTPARRKFLKAASSEIRAILQVAEWLSLANPATSFVFESDERRLLDLQAVDDKIERARQLFGQTLRDKFIVGEKSSDNIRAEIYLCKPEICRKNRSRLMLLVNGRRIDSKTLFAALMGAYGEFLTKGMYPQGAVFITVDPALVDVNVHPAKSEVRFADERMLYHLLYHLVRESLLTDRSVPGYSSSPSAYKYGYSPEADHKERTRNSIREYFDSTGGAGMRQEESLASMFGPMELQARQAATSTTSTDDAAPADAKNNVQVPSGAVEDKPRALLRGKITLQQMDDLYIVAVSDSTVVILDQHAAHERVLYEAALKAFGENSIVSQRLLFPQTVHLEPDDLYVYESSKDSLAAFGFVVSEFGPRQLQLQSVPATLGNKNPEILFRELLDDFAAITGDEEKRFRKKAASFACRSAIMAGDKLTVDEMLELFRSLMRTENPYVCPHGRPTMIKISKDELDVRFGRH
jgi:DNA mismatch repair protein MutL